MTRFSNRLRAGAVAAAAATVVLPMAAAAEDTELHLLFVQGAQTMQADTEAMTLRLVGVAEQTIYFSDRPARVAGIVETKNFAGHWGTGEDSFATNPPNATLTIYDAKAEKNTAAVLVLNDPVLDGSDLVYRYELLAGTVPQEGGAAGLFIDTFGPGGGVGASLHGVGVGARGPGAAGWAGVAVRTCAVDEDC
jgi:hypothetical protein